MSLGYFLLASFPNSRIKPRSATTDAFTYQVTIDDYSLPYIRVAVANPNRTYITLQNLSVVAALWYVYATTTAVNPSVVATQGQTGDMIFFTGTNTLYQKQDDGSTTNWTAVLIQNVGEKILQQNSASLESPQDIYAAADSGAPVVPDVIVDIDQGTG